MKQDEWKNRLKQDERKSNEWIKNDEEVVRGSK